MVKRLLALIVALAASLVACGACSATPQPAEHLPKIDANAPGMKTPVVEGLQLSVSLDKASYTAGCPVYLVAHLKNVSAQSITMLNPNVNPAAAFNVIVQTANGIQAPLTARATYAKPDFDKPYPNPGYRGVQHILAPGRVYDLVFQPNAAFDMTQTGNYFVIVKVLVPKLSGEGTAVLEAGPLQLEIGNPDLPFLPFLDNPTGEEN